jgi:DNA-binding NarL/FixJ family response regulator
MLGGCVNITSKPGDGTKVSLTAPLDSKNGESAGVRKPEDKTREAGQPHPKIKILLVDDHKMMRDGLRKIIESENDMKVVAEAADAGNIVELIRKNQPGVVIMDVNLPGGINGIAATQTIKAELPDIRVIGVSLHDDEDVARNMRNAGAVDYLSKTEAFEALSRTIRNVSGRG